jgi:carotenoid cleavage dioxygenase-like enzyme
MEHVMDGESRVNPYLTGNFAPVRTEDDFVLEVRGALPPGLAGVLYRNGPNPQFEPRDGDYHWFLGDGMIHAFDIAEGQVSYRNRWVRTPKFVAERQAGHALFGSWGNPATSDEAILGTDGGVANTNIVHHAGRLLALEEAHAPFELEQHSLAPRGAFNLGGRVTAHPKFDPATGEMIFFAYADAQLPLSTAISWGVADAAGQLIRRETFQAPYCSMIHDFMVTPDYILIPVLPLSGDLERAMAGGPPFAWDPSQPALVAVMRRDQGVSSLRWFKTEACYVFHIMNAYQAGSSIIADVMKYPSAPLFPLADGSRGADTQAVLTRWTFDLAGNTDSVVETQLDDMCGEFPRFDARREGLSYRHGWFAAQSRPLRGIATDSIAHVDLLSGQRHVYAVPQGDMLGEPVFVPRAADAAEGEGWLLSVAFRGRESVSELLVLDAQNVAAGPVASALLPRRVPYGFHGNFVPE